MSENLGVIFLSHNVYVFVHSWQQKRDKSDKSKESKVTSQTKSLRSADTDDLIGELEWFVH